MTTEILLVRHGQNDWNLDRRCQGHGGPGLNAQGRAEARRTAEALRGGAFAALYSSDLDRACETAEILAGVLGLPVQVDARLRERHQGEWHGRLSDEVAVDYAQSFEHMTRDPLNGGPPGGETGHQVLARMTAALDDMAARHPGGRVVVVSHGGAISLVRWLALGGLDPACLDRPDWPAQPRNGEIVQLTWPPDGRTR